MAMSLTKDIEVRWGDLDAFNHVNNTIFLRYIEEARIDFFEQINEPLSHNDCGPVVVNINCNFRRPIHYPATIRITSNCEVASPKRMIMHHALTDASDPDALYADAQVIVVWVNTVKGVSVALPGTLLDAIKSA
jgi:acyl-CoA thioester hydrolase